MRVSESILVPLGYLDMTAKIGLAVTPENLPVYGRVFSHEGMKVLKIEHDCFNIVRFYTLENVNRAEVSYDIKIVPTDSKINALDEYVDTITFYVPSGDVKGHVFIQHSHPPKRKSEYIGARGI